MLPRICSDDGNNNEWGKMDEGSKLCKVQN